MRKTAAISFALCLIPVAVAPVLAGDQHLGGISANRRGAQHLQVGNGTNRDFAHNGGYDQQRWAPMRSAETVFGWPKTDTWACR